MFPVWMLLHPSRFEHVELVGSSTYPPLREWMFKFHHKVKHFITTRLLLHPNPFSISFVSFRLVLLIFLVVKEPCRTRGRPISHSNTIVWREWWSTLFFQPGLREEHSQEGGRGIHGQPPGCNSFALVCPYTQPQLLLLGITRVFQINVSTGIPHLSN